jgi:4-aminobutyrate aminotransferase-like enzyme
MQDDSLLERRYRVLGRNSPLFYDKPLHLVRGEGVWLYDADGKRYLDAYNNVPHVGHCHPRVVAALGRQAATLNIHTRYLDETIVAYAERLTSLFDADLSMAMFCCTGSEANELALRIARDCRGLSRQHCCSDSGELLVHAGESARSARAHSTRDGPLPGPRGTQRCGTRDGLCGRGETRD